MANLKIYLGIIILVLTAQTHMTISEEIKDSLINESVSQAKVLVDKAYKQTRDSFKSRLDDNRASPGDLMAFFKQPVGGSRNAIRAADYLGATLQLLHKRIKEFYKGPFNVTDQFTICGGALNGDWKITDLLTEEQMDLLSQKTGCKSQLIPKACADSLYRTFTGECNNRGKPSLGAANTGYKRLLAPQYEDGFYQPRGWTENKTYNGYALPLVRSISNEIVSFPTEEIALDDNRTLAFMQWGQWLDHDIDLAATSPSRSSFVNNVDCETSCARENPCFPIKIPPKDPRITNQNDCLPFFRTAPVCNLESPVREQINTLSAYLDANQVYGSDAQTASKLRNLTNDLGLMAINENFTDNGRAFLPFNTANGAVCVSTNKTAAIPCFDAGDVRANEQPGLTAFHTLFLREHNRIAGLLHELNPGWNGETLYQESRKILGAICQKITFKDWLPLLLGSEMSSVVPPYRSYNELEDPRVANVFTNSFRMGHTLVQPFIYRLGIGYRPYEPEPQTLLHETFFATWRFIHQGGIDPLLRGMIANPAKLNRQNQAMVDELREHLFERVKRIGFDLSSLNMQRGRDHGLPGYNAWRRFCGLSAPRNLWELAVVLNNRELAQKFINLYGTPKNIDIWIGGVSEPHVPGGRTGKLFTCLIGNQFRKTRDGDRFYYENPSVFTAAQRMSIDQVTLARIICDNTGITEVPQNVFLKNDYPKGFLKCSDLPQLDLTLWKI